MIYTYIYVYIHIQIHIETARETPMYARVYHTAFKANVYTTQRHGGFEFQEHEDKILSTNALRLSVSIAWSRVDSHTFWITNHGPLEWSSNLESLYTHYGLYFYF